jgi:protein MAK11
MAKRPSLLQTLLHDFLSSWLDCCCVQPTADRRAPNPNLGSFLMSSNPKSAKKARHGHGEHSNVRPVKNQVPSVPDKARGVSFKNGEREVSTSADAPVSDSVSTKVGSLTSRREEKTSFPSSFKIIAGSYERLLYGLEGTTSVSSTGASELEWTLKPIFIFPAHVSCIKAVAASPQGGKWLATGSGDEIIKVWDLRRRKEIGGLMQHEGFLHPILLPHVHVNLTRL